MIPLMVVNRTDRHIRDILTSNLPQVSDTYKKVAPSLVKPERMDGPAGRWYRDLVPFHSGIWSVLLHGFEAD